MKTYMEVLLSEFFVDDSKAKRLILLSKVLLKFANIFRKIYFSISRVFYNTCFPRYNRAEK